MARTIIEIYDSLIAEKSSHSELDSLNSTSQTAIWRLMLYVVAVCTFVLESLWDAFKTDVETTIYNTIPGTIRWYYDQCTEFQFGHSLVWVDNRFKYSIIDESIKIIKRVAIIELNGALIIKVAKLTSGVPEALTGQELMSFQTYIKQIKYAGTKTIIISNNADLLRLTVNIAYDPLLLDSTGTLIADGSTKPVDVAIDNYIANIKFGGVFNKTKLTDAIQLATGITDVVISLAEGKPFAGQYSSINQNYEAESGYFEIDTLTTNYSTIL